MHQPGGRLVNEDKRSFSRMVLKAEVSEMSVVSLVILSLLEARMQARSSRYWFLVISLLNEKS